MMIAQSLFWLVLLCGRVPEQQGDCFEQPTNLQIDRCLSAQLVDAEIRLAQAIADVEKRFTLGERDSLAAVQHAWEKYRELHCRMAGAMYEGGRMQPLEEAVCRITVTNERIAAVRSLVVTDKKTE